MITTQSDDLDPRSDDVIKMHIGGARSEPCIRGS